MAVSTDVGGVEQTAPARAGAATTDIFGNLGDQVGAAVGGLIQEHRTGKFLDEAEKIVDEILDPQEPAVPEDTRIAPVTGDPQADELLNTVYALEDSVAQNSGSKRDAAALQLRQAYQEFTIKYPKMRASLANELSRFERTDPEIAALNILAADQKAAFNAEQEQLDELREYTLDTLNMPPHITFGSEEWAREYTKRDREVQSKITNDQTLAAQESNQNLTIDAHIETLNRGTVGIASRTTETMRQYGEALNSFNLAAINPEAGNNLEVLQLFEPQKQVLIQRLRADMMDLQSRQAAIPAKYHDNAKYTSAISGINNQINMISGAIQALETNQPALSSVYEAFQTAQAVDIRRENPDLARLVDVSRLIAPVVEAAQGAFDGSGAIVGNMIGKEAADSVAQLFGREVGRTYSLASTLGASTQDRQRDIDIQLMDMRDPYGEGGDTVKERQQFAVMEVSGGAMSPTYRAALRSGNTGPQLDELKLKDMALTYRYLNKFGIEGDNALPADGRRKVLNEWASPDILLMAQSGAQVDPITVATVADEVIQMSSDYNTARVAKYHKFLGEAPYGLFTLQDAMDVNFDNVADGIVTFDVPKERFVGLARQTFGDAISQAQLDADYNRFKLDVDKLSRIVSRDLRIATHIEAVKDGKFKPDYEAQLERGFGHELGITYERSEDTR